MPVREVIRTLKQLDEQHGELLQITEQLKQTLIEHDIDELTRILALENQLVKKIEQTEEERANAVHRLILSKGMKPVGGITLTELTKMIFEYDYRQEILELRDRLQDKLLKLKQVSELNRMLVEQALGNIDFTLNLTFGAEGEVTYKHPNKVSVNTQKSGVFEWRA